MIRNPKSNRLMKIGSQMHRKAVREGTLPASTLIQEPIKPPTQHIEMTDDPAMTEVEPETFQKPIKKTIQKPIPQPEEPKLVKRTIKKPEFTVEEGVAEICTDIISENKKDFKKLSQQETDELLRKLLYKKLYDEKPKKSKEKKSKLKIKKAYSSSESESD